VQTVELLVTELFANAFRHARSGPSIEIDVSRNAHAIRVTVADDSPSAPQLEPRDLAAESGRGLQLVDQLATSWGWEPTPNGKCVWFVVEVGP
jgi:anti-sigma regulatory factor (Ser/Thr protein kinase)